MQGVDTIVAVGRILDRLPVSIDSRVRFMAWASLVAQIAIVGTGGAVRLTGSGLGCPTWPRCTPDTFIVMPEQGIHGAIEFGNRMMTFALAAVAALTVLSVFRLRHRRPDLWRLALALAAGIPAQAVLGGITVLTGLNPWLVGAHFILSVVLVGLATVMMVHTMETPLGRFPQAPASLSWLTHAAALAAGVAIVLGVITTGAGPHAGDAATPRNGLDLETLQHLHSYPAYLMLGLTLAVVARVRSTGLERLRSVAHAVLALELAQIALGILQARLGVPALLAGIHMVVACLLVSAMTVLLLKLGHDRVGQGLRAWAGSVGPDSTRSGSESAFWLRAAEQTRVPTRP
jgi:cytochrome c oxidase assembly protein subunit 15